MNFDTLDTIFRIIINAVPNFDIGYLWTTIIGVAVSIPVAFLLANLVKRLKK